MIRMMKYAPLLMLFAAGSCGKQHTTEIPRVPESGTVPIVWSVDMEKNGVASRSLIGSQADAGDIPITQACTRPPPAVRARRSVFGRTIRIGMPTVCRRP